MSSLTNHLITETLLTNPSMYKTAGVTGDLVSAVEGYLDTHLDKTNAETYVASVLNLIGPSILWDLLSLFGFGPIMAPLIALAVNVFGIDIGDLVAPLCREVREMISSGKSVNSSQLNQIINQAAQNASANNDQSEARISSAELLQYSKTLKLAMIDYHYQSLRLLKEPFNPYQTNLYKMAGLFGSATKAAASGKTKHVLVRIIGWLITTILKSAGLLVAGDTIRHMEDKPSAHLVSPTTNSSIPSGSTQTAFPVKSDASLPSVVQMVNTPNNIAQMLIQFAKDTYNGLDDKDNAIAASPNFQAVKNQIDDFNSHHPNSSIIAIPSQYTSKKQLVDQFIDQVAASA